MSHVSADFNAFTQRRRWLEALPASADDDATDALMMAQRRPLMAPLRSPALESLPVGCFGAIAV